MLRSRTREFVQRLLARLGVEIRRVAVVPPASARLFPPKFVSADVAAAVSQLQRESPGLGVVVLTDGYVAVPDGVERVVRCREGKPSALPVLKEPGVFLYACDSDEVGMPWIREIIARGERFIPVPVYRPSTYAHVNDVARRALEAEYEEQTRQGFAKWDFGAGDFLNVVQAIDITAGIPGDYVEVGCYRGSSACVALRYQRASGRRRRCWFFDTFDGFSYDAARKSSDAIWTNTHSTEGEEAIRERIRARAGEGQEVHVRRLNIIEEELPDTIATIAVANVDVDLYEAVEASLNKLAPRIAVGGVMIVEDPGHTPALIGSRVALGNFLDSTRGPEFISIYMESGQTMLIRAREGVAPTTPVSALSSG